MTLNNSITRALNPIMPPVLFMLLFTLCLSCQEPSKALDENRFVIHSELLKENRTCLVSLPESYHEASEADREYPVLILLDGAVHFKAAQGVIHFMSAPGPGNRFMPETIIVAIENIDRERDFTHTRIKTVRENTMGGGKNFLNFIEKELLPYIDEHYRTTPNRTLAGHSLGGLFTINAYMDPNSSFDRYLAIDPSLWWDEDMTAEKVAGIAPSSFQKKLYLASANQGEAKKERNKMRHELFVKLLNERADGKAPVKHEYFKEEDHRSVPLPALYHGLRFLNE